MLKVIFTTSFPSQLENFKKMLSPQLTNTKYLYTQSTHKYLMTGSLQVPDAVIQSIKNYIHCIQFNNLTLLVSLALIGPQNVLAYSSQSISVVRSNCQSCLSAVKDISTPRDLESGSFSHTPTVQSTGTRY